MIKNIVFSLILYFVCAVLIGLYSSAIYLVGHNIMPQQAEGSLIYDNNGKIRGSVLLAQKLESDLFFIPRRSDKFDEICDLALYNEKLKSSLNKSFQEANNPYDISLFTPSASLLDPYIMKHDAIRQAIIIAKKRDIKIEELLHLIENYYLNNNSVFFQLDIVNTTLLNHLLYNTKPDPNLRMLH